MMNQKDEQCLTEDQVLAADDRCIERVEVPEWGGVLYARVVEGAELDAFQQSLHKGQGKDQWLDMANFRARFVQLVACDKHRKPVFSVARTVELGKKSARALDRVFTVGQRINGLTEAEMKDIRGNSEGGPSDDSGSS